MTVPADKEKTVALRRRFYKIAAWPFAGRQIATGSEASANE